jgi:hypothetical protein
MQHPQVVVLRRTVPPVRFSPPRPPTLPGQEHLHRTGHLLLHSRRLYVLALLNMSTRPRV